MKLVVVSGLSGSGKTIALQALEDLGYYCIDNLPVTLLPTLTTHLESAPHRHYKHAAVGIDARNLSEDFEQFPALLEQVRIQGLNCQILFLSADDVTLLKRFSETRRKHPLSGPQTPLAEAVEQERVLLAPLAAAADWHIDTSRTNVHQLRELVRERLGGSVREGLSLLFMSFGYKHGIPSDADFVFDVRCLPNPHWVPTLRPHTGLEQPVIDFLEQQHDVARMYESIRDFLTAWVPRFEAENRSYITVAMGCTGGYHRSVYLADRLAAHFRAQRDNVMVRHRELS